jgi:hypothetical protein
MFDLFYNTNLVFYCSTTSTNILNMVYNINTELQVMLKMFFGACG